MEFAAVAAHTMPYCVHPGARAFSQFLLQRPRLYSTILGLIGEVSPKQIQKMNAEKLRPFVERGLDVVWPRLDDNQKKFDRVVVRYRHLQLAIYTPKATRRNSDPLPAIVHFHQGGYFYGGLCVAGENSFIERVFSVLPDNGMPCIIIDVDYRYGKNDPFPAAVEDAKAALEFVAEHFLMFNIDRHRLAVCGESSGLVRQYSAFFDAPPGGNVAAAAALLARDMNIPLALQLLLIPMVDQTPESLQTESMRQFGTKYGLPAHFIAWCSSLYATPSQLSDPLCSPLLADVSRVAPALVVCGDYDPLRSQGEQYAQKLRANNIAVMYAKLPNTVHHTALACPELLHPHLLRAVGRHLFPNKKAKL